MNKLTLTQVGGGDGATRPLPRDGGAEAQQSGHTPKSKQEVKDIEERGKTAKIHPEASNRKNIQTCFADNFKLQKFLGLYEIIPTISVTQYMSVF